MCVCFHVHIFSFFLFILNILLRLLLIHIFCKTMCVFFRKNNWYLSLLSRFKSKSIVLLKSTHVLIFWHVQTGCWGAYVCFCPGCSLHHVCFCFSLLQREKKETQHKSLYIAWRPFGVNYTRNRLEKISCYNLEIWEAHVYIYK